MEAQFIDRVLNCSDCHGEFIFTAGEQLFFHDKQFKNDPKRCKPCKARRSGLAAAANGGGPAVAGLSRTETRTECSECGIETTVPFKPTQGRPVLCRQCFQAKNRAGTAVMKLPAEKPGLPLTAVTTEAAAAALSEASTNEQGATMSKEAALIAAASMAVASEQSSVASIADLASIANLDDEPAAEEAVPTELLAAAAAEGVPAELLAASVEAPEA